VILGIETSCDETAAAVVSPEGVILSNVISSQAALHAPYGGVVPEVASRRHLELVVPAVERALDDAGMTLYDISKVAVTEGPGLIGALLVGLSAAKALPSRAGCHWSTSTTCTATSPRSTWSGSHRTPPWCCWRPAATLLASVESHGG
jgi:tRNA A37 threonylcarbamoyltransferase TsaD